MLIAFPGTQNLLVHVSFTASLAPSQVQLYSLYYIFLIKLMYFPRILSVTAHTAISVTNSKRMNLYKINLKFPLHCDNS